MTIKFNIPDNNTKQKLSGMKTLTGDSSPQQPPQGVVASTVRATPHTHSSVDPGLRKMAQVMSGGGVTQANPMFFSPLHTPQNWQIAAKRREIYQWARFWYENEPKVAAGIDFLSQFPINGFKLECKSKKVLKYFEKVVKRLRIETIATMISFERNLLGDVFPFKEIECAHCGGSGYLPNGQPCSHPGGNIKRVIILNPESIDVRRNPLASEPVISLVPDEELRATISNPQNKPLIEKMDQKFIAQVLSGIPIQLSNRCVSHIKFNEKDYATYGMTMLRRLFMMLAYKQKLMTANWIVSERLILPVRLVKVGDSDRPAREEDLATVSAQFAQVANDPNLTLVTHHAIDYDWHGACYSDDTEILTENGWKLFKDLLPSEKVATYNQNNNNLEFELPLEYHEYDFKSHPYMQMIGFKNKSMDILVTPNHRMLIERKGELQEVYSQDVKHGDRMLSSSEWSGVTPKNLPYKESPIGHLELDDYLKFVGYYLSEGGLQIERRGKNKTKRIASCHITQNEKSECFNDIKNVIEKVYKKYTDHFDDRKNDTCHQFTINSVEIARYVAKEFGEGSASKSIPNWIKNLPVEKLEILFNALMAGDGDSRKSKNTSRHRYTTVSKNLADDVSEICIKLGYTTRTAIEKSTNVNRKDIYRTYFSDYRKETKFYIKKKYISRHDYDGKVYCVKVPNSWVYVRRNGKVAICGNTGKIHNIAQEMEIIGKEILDGLMLNQSLLNGEGPSYGSAQVGIEAMAQRLESWRRELKDWIENEIFLPISMMQGFVDEEQTKEMRELLGDNTITEWLCPTIKWNDMNLRDDSNQRQLDIQLFDKKLISARRLLQGFDIDYDQMIEEIREESVITGALGQMMPGGMGGGGMGGAMGGMGGDLGGGMMGMGGIGGGGPDMGIPDAGGMGGDLGGGMGGDMGGGMGAAAGSVPPGFKVGKGGSGKKEEPQQMAPMQKTVPLTSLEIKVANSLNSLEIPYQAFLQYEVMVPGQQRPFLIDFAYPQIGVGIEADGDKWHAAADLKAKDAERDQKLANIGWRILRFNENAINEHMDLVQKVIYDNVLDAANQRKKKKADNDEAFIKLAQSTNNFKNLKEIDDKNLKFKIEPVTYNGVNIGDCLYIGV